MVYLEPVYLGWRPQAVSWAQTSMEPRFPESAEKIIELLDKVVDDTLAFLRKECRENIVSVDINLTNSFCNLLESFLCGKYGVTADNLDLMLAQYFTFCYIWVFGGNLHDTSMGKFDEFARVLLAEAVDANLPDSLTIWDWKVEESAGSWVKWEVPAFEYDRNAPFFNLIVPTVDSTRLKYVLKVCHCVSLAVRLCVCVTSSSTCSRRTWTAGSTRSSAATRAWARRSPCSITSTMRARTTSIRSRPFRRRRQVCVHAKQPAKRAL